MGLHFRNGFYICQRSAEERKSHKIPSPEGDGNSTTQILLHTVVCFFSLFDVQCLVQMMQVSQCAELLKELSAF
jgi:hypothetical protein